MLKKTLVVALVFLALAGCEKQQKNTNTVFNKEKPSDFTMQPTPQNWKPKEVPMLPGKAQILGAPFRDFSTQTGSAEVAPQKGMVKKTPVNSMQ